MQHVLKDQNNNLEADIKTNQLTRNRFKSTKDQLKSLNSPNPTLTRFNSFNYNLKKKDVPNLCSFESISSSSNRDNPFLTGIDGKLVFVYNFYKLVVFKFFLNKNVVLSDMPDIRPRKKSIPLVSELVLKTMAATKRNPGLTSSVPRASLNDEELVRLANFSFAFYLFNFDFISYHYF